MRQTSTLGGWVVGLFLCAAPAWAQQNPIPDSTQHLATKNLAGVDSVQQYQGVSSGAAKWVVNGYVKNLFTFNPTPDRLLLDNLVHHRLNVRWYPHPSLKVEVGGRNRLFIGKTLDLVPEYGQLVETTTSNDYVHLSRLLAHGRGYAWHVALDRAFIQWSKQDWEVTVGRQRVNWGVNLVWNPNDIFNAYNFFDFDYEERPGSDAVRVVRYTGQASSVEVVGTVSKDFRRTVLALMRKWNIRGYDVQVFAGKARNDLTLGFGWAGNVGSAGLKGEATYLHPYLGTQRPVLLASVSADYSFINTLYLHGSVLLNTNGETHPDVLAFNTLGAEPLTVRSLSPYLMSTFLQVGYHWHPLVNTSMAVIYYPGNNGVFLNPSITFSVRNNVDLDLIGQLYWDRVEERYQSLARPVYLRVKWSY